MRKGAQNGAVSGGGSDTDSKSSEEGDLQPGAGGMGISPQQSAARVGDTASTGSGTGTALEYQSISSQRKRTDSISNSGMNSGMNSVINNGMNSGMNSGTNGGSATVSGETDSLLDEQRGDTPPSLQVDTSPPASIRELLRSPPVWAIILAQVRTSALRQNIVLSSPLFTSVHLCSPLFTPLTVFA
jgi:hypothetical protein